MKNSDFVKIDATVQQAWQEFMSTHNRPTFTAQQQQNIQLLWQQSAYAMRVCQRYPQHLNNLLATTDTTQQSLSQLYADLSERLISIDEEQEFKESIREFRHLQLAIICWRDLILNAALESILTAMSNVADVCVQVSVDWLHRRLQNKYGLPLMSDKQPAELCVCLLYTSPSPRDEQ